MMKGSFQPSIWPEETAPPHAVNCQICELARQRKRVVWGEGNPEAKILVVLDNPGAREDREGRPFVCGTRQTLQFAAHEAGLGMRELFVTYTVKCRPIRAYDKDLCRTACRPHLMEQLENAQRTIVFCLGNIAVQSYFENPQADVKQMRGQWHVLHGIPTAVSYHPLAVRRRPNLLPHFISDWKMVAEAYADDQ